MIQINPAQRTSEPKSLEEIRDRRNELAGNLSLHQEIYFIETVNDWLEMGILSSNSRYKTTKVQWIKLLRDLDYASKLDRSPSFIQEMIEYGEMQADNFLATWMAGAAAEHAR